MNSAVQHTVESAASPEPSLPGQSKASVALRQADRRLDTLREEADQLDAMILYLQRQRDAVEDGWCEALAERDRLESELWERAAVAMAEIVEASPPGEPPRSVAAPTADASAADEGWAANARPHPPDLSGRLAPPPPSALLLLHEWGLVDDPSPTPPDLTGRSAPHRDVVGPLLEAWEIEEVGAPEPDYVPRARTIRISVVPGGVAARRRPRTSGAPTMAVAVDTAPICTRHPRLR